MKLSQLETDMYNLALSKLYGVGKAPVITCESKVTYLKDNFNSSISKLTILKNIQ